MVKYDHKVLDKITEYVTYIVANGLCSALTARNKARWIISKLNSLDGPYVGAPSIHNCFGKKEGYLYLFFKDPKSKTQWNVLYERFETDDKVEVIVRDICCGGLKDSLQFLSLCDILNETCGEEILYNLLFETLNQKTC